MGDHYDPSLSQHPCAPREGKVGWQSLPCRLGMVYKEVGEREVRRKEGGRGEEEGGGER